jgi:DNA-binding response OmpR family regulator
MSVSLSIGTNPSLPVTMLSQIPRENLAAEAEAPPAAGGLAFTTIRRFHQQLRMSLDPRILLVEDDPTISQITAIYLRRHGFRPLLATDGEAGLQIALNEQPDLVVLDVALPKMDGLRVCHRLRELHFKSPILMLTGRADVEDRVIGLNAGADDYLPKPFDASELLARLQALLRRSRRMEAPPAILELGDTRIDLANRTAQRGGQPLALTKTEYAVLELLAREPGRPVSRQTMLDAVWGYTRATPSRTMDTHIWRLRKKIGDEGEAPRWIQPVHGSGYRLALTPPPPA